MSKLYSRKITPAPMPTNIGVVELIDHYFSAYNSARLREICHLLSQEVMRHGVTVGLSLSGAMTPAGFGVSVLAPLVRNGFIDYIISTGPIFITTCTTAWDWIFMPVILLWMMSSCVKKAGSEFTTLFLIMMFF